VFQKLTVWDSLLGRCLAGVLTAMTLTSCTLLLGLSDKQCATNSDCVEASLGDICVEHVCAYASSCQAGDCYKNDGGVGMCEADKDCSGTDTPRCLRSQCVSAELFAQWSCAPQTHATTDTVQYSFGVVEFLSRQAPADVVVNACRNGDVGCAQPVATFTDTGRTGNVTLTLPRGFYGFFEVRSSELQALLYVTKPIVRDAQARDVPVLATSTVELLAELVGFPWDRDKGLALLEMMNCSGTPSGGVQFKTSRAATDQFYIIDQIPSKEATQTKYDTTDNTADGGFINLEPGSITFSAHLGEDGLELGSFNAQIRANTITYIELNF
jgi:hypothetical protein